MKDAIGVSILTILIIVWILIVTGSGYYDTWVEPGTPIERLEGRR